MSTNATIAHVMPMLHALTTTAVSTVPVMLVTLDTVSPATTLMNVQLIHVMPTPAAPTMMVALYANVTKASMAMA